MRVLAPGGTGLIGRALTASLVSDGHEVCVLSRGSRQGVPVGFGVRVTRWDGVSPAGWEAEVASSDVIVNLAGAGLADARWTAERKRLISDSRVRAGEAIVEAIRIAERRPTVLIQASGAGFYGPHGDEVVTEESPAGSDFLARVCVEWEASSAGVEELGVRRAIVRSGLVLSRDGGALPQMALPYRLFGGGPVGSGRQYVPWIHIDDEVAAIRFLIEHAEARGPFNLAAPEAVTNREFGAELGRVLGRPNVVPKPAFAMRLVLGEMATMLLTGQRVAPVRLQQAGFQFRYPTLAEALRAIYG